MIPRVIHRIWIGDQPMPKKFQFFWNRFKKVNPTWTFKTWTDHEAASLDMKNRALYEAAISLAGKADVFRYEILAQNGGVYVDCDTEPLRPYDELLEDGLPFAGWEDENNVAIGVLGSPAGHPAMVHLVDALGPWVADRPGFPPNEASGPVYITSQWRDRSDVHLYPAVAFYPVAPGKTDLLNGRYPAEAYSVHHWAHSWAGQW